MTLLLPDTNVWLALSLDWHPAHDQANLAAWAVMDEIVGDPRVELRTLEPAGSGELWRSGFEVPSVSPKVWMDAYLSAFGHAAGATLVTSDRALAQTHAGDVITL